MAGTDFSRSVRSFCRLLPCWLVLLSGGCWDVIPAPPPHESPPADAEATPAPTGEELFPLSEGAAAADPAPP